MLAYDLELFDGLVHTDLGFAVSWGAFPVLTSAYAQTSTISWSAAVLAAGGGAALSGAAQPLESGADDPSSSHVDRR